MESTVIKQNDTSLQMWIKGAIQALPIVLGYVPVGFAYGVLAEKAGLSIFNTLLMSIIVYAGSAQLIAVGLISAGTSPVSLIITTFIVNLRHMLLSASLSRHLCNMKKFELGAFAYELTDETFALHSTRFSKSDFEKRTTFAINVTSQISWILGSFLGITAGQLISSVEPYALDYALPAMFIALLVIQINNLKHLLVAVFAGAASLAFYMFGFTQWNVILATLIAATFGVMIEKWIKN